MPIESTKTVIVTAAASVPSAESKSDWIPLNQYAVPFNVGFGVVIDNSGAAVFRVEHTFDNVFDTSITPTVFVHEDVSSNDGNVDGNYAFPVRATRVAVQSVSGAATIDFTVLQTGL